MYGFSLHDCYVSMYYVVETLSLRTENNGFILGKISSIKNSVISNNH